MLSPSPGCAKLCEDSAKPATERRFQNNQEGLRTDWLFGHMRRLSLTTYRVMMTRLHWTRRALTGEWTGLGRPVEQQLGGVGLGEPAMPATWTRALPLCASKHAHHVCFVKGGCQHGDRTKGKAGLCGVVTSLDVSELRGKRQTECLPASSGCSGGEHTFPGGTWIGSDLSRRVSASHGTQTPARRCAHVHLALPAMQSVGSLPRLYTGEGWG